MNEEFRNENLPKWENLLRSIFKEDIPERYEWVDNQDIISILNILGASDTFNHVFFASSGGLDLISATESHEEGCIEIHCPNLTSIIKPEKLMFESFSEGDYEWAYFRIVLDDLARTNVYLDQRYDYEILTELSPGNYEKRSVLDDGYYKGRPLPPEARAIGRILTGDLVIFNKASLYKANLDNYDGRHSPLGVEGFRDYIEKIVKKIKELN